MASQRQRATPRQQIERLTPEQEARLPVFHREWLDIGRSTELADRPRAEAAISAMYAHIQQPAPAFVWCDSPLTAHLAMQALTTANRDSLGPAWGPACGTAWGPAC